MEKAQIHSVGIIGAGKLGSALAIELAKRDLLSWIVARSPQKAEAISAHIPNIKILNDINEIEQIPDLIIIAVNDNNIDLAAQALSEQLSDKAVNSIIIHTSGSMGLSALESLKSSGALCLCAHPCQTFYYYREDLFHGIAWAIESKENCEQINKLISNLGGMALYLSAETLANKPLYHLSAVFASNFLNTAIYFASQTAKAAGIDAQAFLSRLIETTADNAIDAIKMDNIPPLTGPISRGDDEAIKKHIGALKDQPDIQAAYKLFSQASLILAERESLISPEKADKIRKRLEEG